MLRYTVRVPVIDKRVNKGKSSGINSKCVFNSSAYARYVVDFYVIFHHQPCCIDMYICLYIFVADKTVMYFNCVSDTMMLRILIIWYPEELLKN